MPKPPKPDKVIDCFGLLCPVPIIQTAKALMGMKKGEVLEVIADDEGIVSDMPAWCASTGNLFIGLESEGKVYHVFVKKVR